MNSGSTLFSRVSCWIFYISINSSPLPSIPLNWADWGDGWGLEERQSCYLARMGFAIREATCGLGMNNDA